MLKKKLCTLYTHTCELYNGLFLLPIVLHCLLPTFSTATVSTRMPTLSTHCPLCPRHVRANAHFVHALSALPTPCPRECPLCPRTVRFAHAMSTQFFALPTQCPRNFRFAHAMSTFPHFKSVNVNLLIQPAVINAHLYTM